MTISIRGMRPAKLRALRKRAKDAGKPVDEVARELIERGLDLFKPLDEVLKPIRDDFRRSGITEQELDEIVDRARTAAYRKRRGSRK